MLRWIVFACLSGVAICRPAVGQTPFASMNTGGEVLPEARGTAVNNPWFGSTVTYKFGDSSDFADNLLVAGRIFYDIDLGLERVHLPVLGTFSKLSTSSDSLAAKLEELALSQDGLLVGLFPFYEIDVSSRLLLTIHGMTAWKLNAFQSDSTVGGTSTEVTSYLHQFRASIGVEAAVGNRGDGDALLTLSVAPVVSLFDKDKYTAVFGDERSSFVALEMTGVVPLGAGIGLLVEGVLAEESSSIFRVGLVTAAKKGDLF